MLFCAFSDKKFPFVKNFRFWRASETTQKSRRRCVGLRSATGIRTRVYGVRGRCPRPLDDSTIETLFSKAGAKVLLFFDMTKYFRKKVQKKRIFVLLDALLQSRTRDRIDLTVAYDHELSVAESLDGLELPGSLFVRVENLVEIER